MKLFRRRTLEDILSEHADALNRDQDMTDQLLRKFESRWPELALLLILARSLHRSLVRQEAPPSLAQPPPQAILAGRVPVADRRRLFWIGGIASVIATTAGVVAWFYWRTGPDGEQSPPATTAF